MPSVSPETNAPPARAAGPAPFAWQWLRMLASGECSAAEIARYYLDRVHAVNPAVNAVMALDEEQVLAAAKAADAARAAGRGGALLGLPLTVKDNLEVEGLPCTSGTWGRRAHVPDRDATVIDRVRGAGAVILAKTSLPELAASYETDNALIGPTNNPWSLDRTTGGSSGGEAALLAADASALGLGTDGGGSIRVPSHYCGLFGLRPTVGRVPLTGAWPPDRASGYADLTCIGPMGRCARDVALLLAVIAGADDVDPFAAPVPLRSWQEVSVGGLRVAFYPDDLVAPTTEETRATVRQAAEMLRSAGAAVVEVDPPDLGEATALFFAAAGAGSLAPYLAGADGHHTEQFRTFLASTAGAGGELTAAQYFAGLERLHAFRARIRAWVGQYDAVLTPVAGGPAPPHGTPPAGIPQDRYFQYEAFNYTHTFSVAGLPAMSVPVGRSGGLPVGVQVASSAWREDVVIAVAAALEQAGARWSPAVPAR